MRANYIKFKNFLSYGNKFTEIDLNNGKSNLIYGVNGRGKSATFEALYFNLTGKPYRKINKSGLVNTTNKKDCLTVGEYEANGNKYEVTRGIKPNIFIIKKNGKELDEDSKALDQQKILQQLLQFDPHVFKQTSLISTGFYTPFLKLEAKDKRLFIESILSIGVFSDMNNILKIKANITKDELFDVSSELNKYTSNLEIIKEMNEKIKSKSDDNQKRLENSIEISETEIINYDKDIDSDKKDKEKYQKSLDSGEKKCSNESSYNEKRIELEINIRKSEEELKYFDENFSCSECKQEIDEKHKKIQRDIINQTLKNNKEELDDINSRLKKIAEFRLKLDKIENHINKLENRIWKNESLKDNREELIKSAKIEIENIKLSKDELKDETKLEKEIKKLDKKYENLSQEMSHFKIANKILSDKGIKTYIIKKYIPHLNKYVNKYLDILQCPFRLKFNEHLEATIAIRGYEKLSYGSFSAGEKQRVDLALMFSFIELAKLKNSVHTNIILLDEVADSSMDETGIEGIVSIIESLKRQGMTIYCISHREELKNSFDNSYMISKGKFSKIEKL